MQALAPLMAQCVKEHDTLIAEVGSADAEFVPGLSVEIDDVDLAKKVLRLVDALEDSDDVQNVFANFDFSDGVSSALDDDED